MSFETQEKDDVLIVSLTGKLMGEPECSALKNTVERSIERGFKKVVMDFANLKWANSSGIGAIISCYLTLKRQDGDLKFAQPTERVNFYLEISKLDTLFEIYDSLEDAIESFNH